MPPLEAGMTAECDEPLRRGWWVANRLWPIAAAPAAMTSSKKSSTQVPYFHFAFVFGCDLLQSESKTVKAKTVAGGSVLWIEFTTSPSLEAALMAAASRATRRAGVILFSYVK
jgi:hypothetical protein